MPMWMIGGWIVPGGLSCGYSCKRPAKVLLLHAIMNDAMVHKRGLEPNVAGDQLV